ncbi:hypothetical protein C8A00DRAFT_28719 [Chaetomidium leptoderma]|uniref:Uncharacterized protein n=1 Tax=Chaetomidium leptoderma TaxID=669021 RepID=A0AAN6VVY9_9PEZI|nr:hypothetical protein C8A00DRAFT_28719 [Chaetomidium leptoderma]
MSARRSARKLPEKTEKAVDVIEILSSDSEPEDPEEPEIDDEAPESVSNDQDVIDQPLLRAAGIKYKNSKPDEEEEEPLSDRQQSPSSAKLAVRVRGTGSTKHRHVSIEIPLPTSSELRRRKAEAETSGSQEGNDEEVFKTPSDKRHITFDDSEHDEFVTPREAPSRDPLESSIARPTGKDVEEEEEEEEEDSDDEAPPEAVSTRAAEAETLKAAGAAAKAAEQQVAASKRKRQERDAFLRRQAEERKRTQKPTRQESDDEGDATPGTQEPPLETEKRKREVPKLLPLELLESDDEDVVSQQASSAPNGQHKRRKLGGAEQALLRGPKLPKDKRLGSTAYRVMKGTGDARLAPKVRKQAVGLRETLLQRDRVAQPRGGFFVRNR